MKANPTPVAATTTTPATTKSLGRASLFRQTETQLLIAVITLYAVYTYLFPATFPTFENSAEMSRVGSILLVAAIAQAFTLIIGGFDLSIAANMGFVSVVTASYMASGGSVGGAVLLGLGSGTAVGLTNGLLIARLGITPFVATLGTLTFLKGLSDQLSNGGSVAGLPRTFALLGRADWGIVPSAVAVAAVMALVAWIILSRSRAGLYIFSIGGSRETARVSGIPVVRYEVLAYTLCGFFTAVAGILLTSRVSIGQTTLGSGFELLSIATAVIGGVAIGGGTGKLSGVFLGVVLLTILTTGLDIAGVNQFLQQMITGVVLIVTVLIAQNRNSTLASLMKIFGLRR